MIRLAVAFAMTGITALNADAAHSKTLTSHDLTMDRINSVGPETNDAALITKAEVLLDRNH